MSKYLLLNGKISNVKISMSTSKVKKFPLLMSKFESQYQMPKFWKCYTMSKFQNIHFQMSNFGLSGPYYWYIFYTISLYFHYLHIHQFIPKYITENCILHIHDILRWFCLIRLMMTYGLPGTAPLTTPWNILYVSTLLHFCPKPHDPHYS